MLRSVLLIIFVFTLMTMVHAQEQNEQLAKETIARINEWRIEEGTWPLKVNPVLTEMAVSHASYLASLDELPENLHAGPNGLNPRERALLDPYAWSHYELPEQIAIGENAGIGTLNYAMSFWETSDIHRSTSLNPAYREIGVGAVPYKDGHLFIVVFGGRPNILPALLDPRDGQTIYLTNEMFEYATFFDSVQSVLEYQMFGAEGEPLFDEPQPWSQVITIPEDAGDTVYLLLTDGDHQVLSRVNRESDRVIVMASLTEPEPEATPTEEPIVEAEPTATPEPQQEIETVEDEPTAEPTIEPTPEPTEEPVDEPNLLLLYTEDTLNIINVSGVTASWETMELQGVINVPFTQFTKFSDLNLTEVADRHCVQIRSNAISGDVVKPDSCRWVRSLITVQPDRLFWAAGDFDVFQHNVSFGTCSSEENVCAINLD